MKKEIIKHKLLLIDISCYRKRDIGIFGTPLGLLSIGTFLKKNLKNLNIRIIDAGIDFTSEEEIIRIINEENPNFIGIRAVSINKIFLIQLVKVIKSLFPTIFIIVGGPYITTAISSETFEGLLADVIVCGEGEATILALFNRLLKNEKYDDLKGIAIRKENRFIFNGKRELISNLDCLPYTDYSLINLEKYFHKINFGYMKSKFVCIESSRGCPYGCIYCHNMFDKKIRFKSSKRVFNEIERLHKQYGIIDFFFSDDIFNLDYNRAIDIFNKIINSKIKIRIHFTHGMRGDLIDKFFIDKMIEAGVTDIAFAIETPVKRLQEYIKKNLNLNKLKENIDYICEKNIIVRLFFMYGFPTETEQEVEETLRYMEQFKKCVLPFLFPAKYYKGTVMYSLAIKEGFSLEDLEESQHGLYNEIQFCQTPYLSKEFMKKIHYKWVKEIILDKERMINAITTQRKYLSDEEIKLFYSSFFGHEIKNINQLIRDGHGN